MRRASVILVICCSAMLSCARQDEHSIHVVHHDGQDFVASECDAFSSIVHTAAGQYRLEETQGSINRDTFPRYRSYWSRTSPLGLDLYCGSNMLQVTVTAVRGRRGSDAYAESIAELSIELKNVFGPDVEESDNSILVSALPW